MKIVLSAQAFQPGDAAGGNPFRDIDVAVGSETGVMRMDELAVDPSPGVAPIDFFLLHYVLNVVAESGDYFVLLVEQGDTGVQFGHQHEIFPSVCVGRPTVALDRLEIFSLEGEKLECIMGPVADHHFLIEAGAPVDPYAVRGLSLIHI